MFGFIGDSSGKKIETDTTQPRYLLTETEIGYRLAYSGDYFLNLFLHAIFKRYFAIFNEAGPLSG